MDMYTIYEHPRDFPNGFVVRRWTVTGAPEPVRGEATYHASIGEARRAVPQGLTLIPRSPDDDPKVLESWL